MADVQDLLSATSVVAVVGVAAAGCLLVDLILRELDLGRPVAVRLRRYGAVLTVVFLALAVLRFVTFAG